jgi:DNA-binding CsgD family transcriptional regulator
LASDNSVNARIEEIVSDRKHTRRFVSQLGERVIETPRGHTVIGTVEGQLRIWSDDLDQYMAELARLRRDGWGVDPGLNGGYVSVALCRSDRPIGATPTNRTKRGGLSDRDWDVLFGVILGETSRQMSDRLGLSVRTVGVYRTRVRKRLGLPPGAAIRYSARQATAA